MANIKTVGVIGAGLVDRFGLGLLDKRRIVQPSFERLGFLLGGFQRFGEPGLFGGDVDDAFEGNDNVCIPRADLHRGSRRRGFKSDAVEPCQSFNSAGIALDDAARGGARLGQVGIQPRARRDAQLILGGAQIANQRNQPFHFALRFRIDPGLWRGP